MGMFAFNRARRLQQQATTQQKDLDNGETTTDNGSGSDSGITDTTDNGSDSTDATIGRNLPAKRGRKPN